MRELTSLERKWFECSSIEDTQYKYEILELVQAGRLELLPFTDVNPISGVSIGFYLFANCVKAGQGYLNKGRVLEESVSCDVLYDHYCEWLGKHYRSSNAKRSKWEFEATLQSDFELKISIHGIIKAPGGSRVIELYKWVGLFLMDASRPLPDLTSAIG